MNKIRRAGDLFEQHTESRGTMSAKYGEQGNYVNKIWKAGELFQQNMKSRVTISV